MVKRYRIVWEDSKGQEYGSTLESKQEAELLLNYIETQDKLSLIEYREIG